MKRILLLLAAMTLFAASAGAQGWMRQPTPNDTLRSTVVLPDNSVVFQIYAPEAKSVAVAGDLPWDKPARFVKQENGVWKARLNNMVEGIYRYRFIVDGMNVYDPKAPNAGETSALLTVDAKGDEFFAMKNVPHGAVAQRYYWSEPLKEMRRLHVWTPAGYENSTEKLPVLYLVHGGGDTDNSWPGVGAAGFILDNLMAEGKMKPMVVVMPNGSIHMPDGNMMGEVPVFAEDMITSIIPFIESNYRVYTDQANRAMAGLSMGGMETRAITLARPEVFAYYGLLSGGTYAPEDIKDPKQVKGIFLSCGGKEGPDRIMQAAEALKAAGYNAKGYVSPGTGHEFQTWRRSLLEMAPMLFK